jgi:hypothetical protein
MQSTNGFDVSSLVDIVVGIATLLTLWFVYKTLKADHDWRRRQIALELNRDWLEKGTKSANIIEKAFPHIRYQGQEQDKNELTKSKAREVYTSTSDETTLEIRRHIIGLLNQMDYIAMAYFNGIADKDIVDSSMKYSLIAWFNSLHDFISVVQELENQPYWHTFQELISHWQQSQNVKMRKTTA